EHQQAPHLRVLQKRLAEEITVFVHSQEALENAISASNALFSNVIDELKKLDEKTFLEVFEGVPQTEFSKSVLQDDGLDIIAALAEKGGFLKSNGEARRALKENSISVNKAKVQEGYMLTETDLINGRFVLLQRGKKNYFVINVVE
ncbi:MAG: tyrosine--tRNA ligase, partial [Aestuariibaculum sp.]